VQSVCPYCAVGCGQRVYVKRVEGGEEKVVQIEGDPDSPISRGRLCPKGSASEQLVNSPGRQVKALYRAPYASEW
jgi:formate dehydrogenase major subunit